jgi:2-C-methyl-D-erythritol 4-phosphate cytidylyltransferase
MKEKAAAIVLAGGSGIRMNTALPKQFMELAGKPVIIHSLEKFDRSALISDIVIVCVADHIRDLNALINKYCLKKVYQVIAGGKTRQESSSKGLKNCPQNTEFVLIHDAARPFVEEKIIEDVLNAAKDTGAAGPVIDIDDTVVAEQNGRIKDIPARDTLKRIQTPQGFRYKTIIEAHKNAAEEGIRDASDDCSLVVAIGRPVTLVRGALSNIKITTPADMFLAERFL